MNRRMFFQKLLSFIGCASIAGMTYRWTGKASTDISDDRNWLPQKWTPDWKYVESSLPQMGQEVLVVLKNGSVRTAYLSMVEWNNYLQQPMDLSLEWMAGRQILFDSVVYWSEMRPGTLFTNCKEFPQ